MGSRALFGLIKDDGINALKNQFTGGIRILIFTHGTSKSMELPFMTTFAKSLAARGNRIGNLQVLAIQCRLKGGRALQDPLC